MKEKIQIKKNKLLTIFRCEKFYYFLSFLFFIFIFVKFFILIEELLSFLNKYSEGMLALSAFLAVIFGAFGLDAWKKKLKGKTDYDIARQYLKLVLQLRDSLKLVRNSFIPLSEIKIALEKNGFDSEDYKNKEIANKSVYSLRWNKVQEAWTNLEAILVEAEISWGVEAINIQKELDQLVRKLRGAIWLFINYSENIKTNDEKFNLIYGTFDENDNFNIKIDKEIENIRNFLKHYL